MKLIVLGILAHLLLTGFSAAPVRNPVSPVIQIDQPEKYSKVYALSDVHGMFQNLTSLLKSVKIIDEQNQWTAQNSLLIIVGDSIDKGPDSVAVIDLFMQLQQQAQKQGGNVIHLLGNHEAEFLANPQNSKAKELLADLKRHNLSIEEFSNEKYPRGAFLHSMPVAARIGKWFFSHAGFVKQKTFAALLTDASSGFQKNDYNDSFFSSNDSLIEAKDWWAQGSATRTQEINWLNQNGFEGVVFGHQPSALNVTGAVSQSADSHLIKIDNGMAPAAGSHAGNVLVFKNPAQMNLLEAPEVDALPQAIVPEIVLKKISK